MQPAVFRPRALRERRDQPRYLRDKRRTRVANNRRQRCRAEARSPLGTHGADAGAQSCGHLGRRGSGPQRREQRCRYQQTHRGAAQSCAPTLSSNYALHVSLRPVTTDLAELARRGRRRRRGVPVFVLALLFDLIAGVHLVVQAVRLVDTFLIDVAVLYVVVLAVRFVHALLIVDAIRFVDLNHFALNLGCHGMCRSDFGHRGRGSRGCLPREQRRQCQRYDDSQQFPKHVPSSSLIQRNAPNKLIQLPATRVTIFRVPMPMVTHVTRHWSSYSLLVSDRASSIRKSAIFPVTAST